MKKIISILLVVLVAFSFVSCKGECELCGQTAYLEKMTIEGEDQKLCEECYAKIGECEVCSKTLPLREYKPFFPLTWKVCQQCYDDLKTPLNPMIYTFRTFSIKIFSENGLRPLNPMI